MELLLPLLILALFLMLFVSTRRQRREALQMQELQAALEDGDVVTTTSGLRGIVVDASYEETVDLEIADGVVTTWARAAIREKVVDPVDAEDAAEETVTDDHAGGTARP